MLFATDVSRFTVTLVVLCTLFVVLAIAGLVGLIKAKQRDGRIKAIEDKLGIAAAVPFFKFCLSVLIPEITHPHERYAELDALGAEALLEPEIHMSEERVALMDKLLDERAQDFSEAMRPNEHAKAMIVKQLVHLIRAEGSSGVPMTKFTIVGQQAPTAQEGDPVNR